jgi:putative acetyltransferase
MIIRPEAADDGAAIRAVVATAFGQSAEADLVDALRKDGDLVLSLVAAIDGEIVGHVGFSRLWIAQDGQRLPGIALAPVSVLPRLQRNGVGRALIGAGHLRLKTAGEGIVFVLGDPAYYQRFGFSAAAAAPFACVYQGEYLQALRLAADAPVVGTVTYAPAFGALE